MVTLGRSRFIIIIVIIIILIIIIIIIIISSSPHHYRFPQLWHLNAGVAITVILYAIEHGYTAGL